MDTNKPVAGKINWLGLFIGLVVAIVSFVYFANLEWGGLVPPFLAPKPTPWEDGLLAGATFYTGPRPAPAPVSYFDESGRNRTVLALPGQILITAPPKAPRADFERAIGAVGVKYKILSGIPKIGSYLIEISPGREMYFITALRSLQSLQKKEYSAEPNRILEIEADGQSLTLDLLSNGLLPACGELLPANDYFNSPDPSAKVITALIDDFVPREDPTEKSHGENTESALRANCGGCPILRLDLGSGSIPTDVVVRALAIAVANAEINCQDVVVSLSIGVSTMFNTGNPIDRVAYADAEARNEIAGRDWEAFMKNLLNVLANSKWAKDGHVRLHKSAGNGALLCDPPSEDKKLCGERQKIVDNDGIDLTLPMERLGEDPIYGPLMKKNVQVWCALNHTSLSNRAGYSNYGNGIACLEPYGNLEGTSFSTPIGAGKDYLAVKNRLTSVQRQTSACVSLPTKLECDKPPLPIPTTTITTTLRGGTACSTDAECIAYVESLCAPGDSRCLAESKLFRCGLSTDKLCHACYRVVSMTIEGVEGYDGRCFTCAEGLAIGGLGEDGCPNDVLAPTYCERGDCVAQMGSTIVKAE